MPQGSKPLKSRNAAKDKSKPYAKVKKAVQPKRGHPQVKPSRDAVENERRKHQQRMSAKIHHNIETSIAAKVLQSEGSLSMRDLREHGKEQLELARVVKKRTTRAEKLRKQKEELERLAREEAEGKR